MHPGPMNRGVEIASDVADLPRAVITDQVTNGIAVRMSLLYLILGGDGARTRGAREEARAPTRPTPEPEPTCRSAEAMLRCRTAVPAASAWSTRPRARTASPTSLVEDESIAEVGAGLAAPARGGDRRRRAGAWRPGLVDLHAHLREPGFEHKETVETGSRAAAAGGFTALCAMPNTDPVTDNVAIVAEVRALADKAGLCDVFPAGAITRGLEGESLTDIAEMAEAGRPPVHRRRPLRPVVADDAPGARVRERVRRGHQPARAGRRT